MSHALATGSKNCRCQLEAEVLHYFWLYSTALALDTPTTIFVVTRVALVASGPQPIRVGGPSPHNNKKHKQNRTKVVAIASGPSCLINKVCLGYYLLVLIPNSCRWEWSFVFRFQNPNTHCCQIVSRHISAYTRDCRCLGLVVVVDNLASVYPLHLRSPFFQIDHHRQGSDGLAVRVCLPDTQ